MRFKLSFLVVLMVLISLAGCASSGAPEAKQRYATIVTSHSSTKSRSYPIEIYQIDNRRFDIGEYDPRLKRYSNSRASHRVTPGTHQISALAITRPEFNTSSTLSRLDRPLQPLVENFESGRRYYLQAERVEGSRRYQVVIWKVEDMKNGLLKLDK